jgi:hypothetical protein
MITIFSLIPHNLMISALLVLILLTADVSKIIDILFSKHPVE